MEAERAEGLDNADARGKRDLEISEKEENLEGILAILRKASVENHPTPYFMHLTSLAHRIRLREKF